MLGRNVGVDPVGRDACPCCGHAGRAVSRLTVKALLKPDRLATLIEPRHRFCPTESCAVVYFGQKEIFRQGDVNAPGFCKGRAGNRTVCHCFSIDEEAVRQGPWPDGHSAAFHRIRTLV